MKNEFCLISLLASLVIAINTEWCKPAKALVIISALLVFASSLKGLTEYESENDPS